MSTLVEQLREQRSALIQKATDIAQASVAEGRNLTVEEQASFDQIIADAEGLGQRAADLIAAEQRSADIEASFIPSAQRTAPDGSPLGDWARSAQPGAAFDLRASRPGLENRAIESFRRGEQRAMTMGGTSADAVYSSLWETAVSTSQILQAGVQIITTQDGNTLPMPAVTAHAVGASAAANAPVSASDAGLSLVNLSVSKNGYLTLVPYELTQDATFDLDGYLSRAAGRELGNQISQIAASALIAGATVSGATAPTASVAASGVTFTNALKTLFWAVAGPYRNQGSWLLSDGAAAAIDKITDAQGRYVLQQDLTGAFPFRLQSKPVFTDYTLPAPTGTAKPIYFGDFSALAVRIAGGIRFERSAEYAFGNDQIAYRALVRTGAAVLDVNAIKFLALTAS
ncbi:MAG TPA: phage major capsid protein [Microbacteriaceae bacterium]|nr:phage major capsid protein [Microbacteriaceae bacterium]